MLYQQFHCPKNVAQIVGICYFSCCLKATSTREAFVTTTITNRDFNRNVCRAKRAAASGPVIITNRGNAAYVLLAYEEYARLLRQQPHLLRLFGFGNAKG